MADLKGFNNDEQRRSTAASMAADNANHVSAAVKTDTNIDTLGLKNPAFWYSGGFIVVFVLMAIFAEEQLA